jgi:polyphosphate kinase
MSAYFFANRDISWLSFNERVLQEAGKTSVPLNERIKFLSIYSSNLDEFYRVRMPALMALKKMDKEKTETSVYRP